MEFRVKTDNLDVFQFLTIFSQEMYAFIYPHFRLCTALSFRIALYKESSRPRLSICC